MRNRLILLGITASIWAMLKMVDSLVTGPELLFLLYVALALMITHSVWLFSAQSEWHKKARHYVKRRVSRAVKKVLNSSPGSVSVDPVSEDALNGEADEAWHPWVDIFVAAKNESRVIGNTVATLFKLDYDRFYVWVIDDGSTDDMPEVLAELCTRYDRLRVIRREPGSVPGKSAALNDALPLSKGDVIAVFDADAYVEPDFLNQILPHLQGEGVGAVQAQKRIYLHQKGFLVGCQASEYSLDTYFQVGRDLIGGAVELRGNGELIKRAALIDVGGWNNRTLTDDLDLSMRLLVSNWDIKFCPDAHVFEEGVTNIKALWRQRRRWAEGSIRRYLDYIFPLNSPTRLSLVERIDTLVFTVYFVVPALILMELTSDVLRFFTGGPTYGSFLALSVLAVLWVSQLNLFIATRLYRKLGVWEALVDSVLVTAYLFLHWIPCIVISFGQILFGKQASTWHRTEHIGQTTSNV
ncbi:MAG: glycosyltransferase family 2 protein [Candidatus Melainabacteria bacterium]|nr:glycosyltransferase family 2 protein [Candidatus Melainabacteria bacterium]